MNREIYKNVYGITGILGSGKTTAAKIFQKLGAQLIIADEIAKSILAPNYAQYKEVIAQIQKEILPYNHDDLPIITGTFNENNLQINRINLAKLVFQDKIILEKLNSIIHPHVRKLFQEKKATYNENDIILYDIPLLYENNLEYDFKKVIVVYTPTKMAIERVVQNKHFKEDDIKKRLSFQISIEKKQELADFLIDNTKDMDHLEHQVQLIWKEISTSN